ncbi:MAG: Glu/Leu/Phe/Val dehydrogenase dimerization domain-containing protein [Rubricella sp.]
MELSLFTHPEFDGHEQVVFAHDRASGLRAIIGIHDTARGPALGGCRVYDYASEAEALTDALRLSRGMSYKAALADLPLGGGKAVIWTAPDRPKTPAMMRAFGQAVERLAGRYITAEDVGTTPADMDEVAKETAHVSGLTSGVGDPSPKTAHGVFLCLQAAVRHRLERTLDGVHVAVKGLGHVGWALAEELHGAGARLTVADIRPEQTEAARAAFGAGIARVEDIARVEADVFAPCALGGDLSAETIPTLGAGIVCGAANNQLATTEDDARLAEAGVLYCPDYLVNAAGLVTVARTSAGLSEREAQARIAAMPETLAAILEEADQTGTPPGRVADARARAAFRPAPERVNAA